MANLGEAVSPPPPPPPPAAAAPHHHPSHAAAGSVEKQRRQQQEGQPQQQKSSSTSSSNSYVEELKCAQRVSISVDLVLAAKRELGFLRTIESLPFLHGGPAIYRAIRRYKLVNLLAVSH
jgi:type IV secretory pathway VirB10-like protein